VKIRETCPSGLPAVGMAGGFVSKHHRKWNEASLL